MELGFISNHPRTTPQAPQQPQRESMARYINQQRLEDTFIRLAKTDTNSCEEKAEKDIHPSTEGQVLLGKDLAKELEEIGLSEININEHGLVTATFESNMEQKAPTVGVFAHLDTSEDAPSKDIRPIIHRNYQGGDINLEEGTKIDAETLKPHIGEDVITSDGKTLLGADDKAGIAEILEALRVFKENPHLEHPKIRVAFTPDEETGSYIKKFNVKSFGADIAYTVDGEAPHIIDTETFNAVNGTLKIKGVSIHPGEAYGKMVNSIEVANQFMNGLPKDQTPSTTKDREGFYHVEEIEGKTGETKVKFLVRDFDAEGIKKRREFVEGLVKKIQDENPKAQVSLELKERYKNMKEYIKAVPDVIEYAKEGLRRSGLIPQEAFVRGGTDGSNLTINGLPTLNLGAGGKNFHSKAEFTTTQSLVKCTENILNILAVIAEKAMAQAQK